jgi:nucleotide-binding universal stress UspA family protein
MKILATFDGTPYSEETLPVLRELAALPGVEFTLLAVAHEPSVHAQFRGEPMAYTGAPKYGAAGGSPASPTPRYPETKDQAVERVRSELDDYLLALASSLPASTRIHVETHISDHPARMIVERAREERPTMIVMASHSRAGMMRAFIGSTTEEVVRSGVAPVLVVHPRADAE